MGGYLFQQNYGFQVGDYLKKINDLPKRNYTHGHAQSSVNNPHNRTTYHTKCVRQLLRPSDVFFVDFTGIFPNIPGVALRHSHFGCPLSLTTEMEEIMTKINLREQYPDFYKTDYIIEVPDEVAAVMKEHDRLEAAYRRRTYYHKAHYSLDRGDGIEYDALFVSMTPCELYERKVTMEQLHAAIAALPDKQAKRIYAYYFLGLTESAIAKSEGVSVASVSESIQRGLRNMETFLKNRL